MKALVVGATGQTGYRIVKQLVEKGIPVRAVVRDLAKAKELLPTEVEVVTGDVLEPSTIRAAMAPGGRSSTISDCTVLMCATGAQPSLDVTGPYKVDYEGTKNLVDVAKEAGIERFIIVSSLCVSKFFHPLNLFWLVLYWKKQAEDYLQSSGLNYTIVRPGGLRSEDSGDPIVMAPADTLFEGSIPREKVAQVCVAALSQPEANNKIVEIVTRENAKAQEMQALFASVG
ncbi:MAG: SDR family oxidoreductase [Cyanobacteria bacterium P01_D01_bin.44]